MFGNVRFGRHLVVQGDLSDLSILIRSVNNFVRNPNITASFHEPAFYPGTKMFLGEVGPILVDHRKDCNSGFVVFLNKSMTHTLTTSISMLPLFLSSKRLYSYDRSERM